MSRHNSLEDQGRSGPLSTTLGWEQQRLLQQSHNNSNGRTNALVTTTPLTTDQELTNTFVLERYSRHNPGGSCSSTPPRSNNNLSNNPANQTNNNIVQTKTSTFGGVLTSPYPLPSPSPSRTTTTNNNYYSAMSIASDSRSWSVSTAATSTTGVGVGVGSGGGGGGRSLPETKEQSNWIHLSTPHHCLTLTLKLSFRPQTPADLNNCRPLLLIQTGDEVLDCLGLDRASVRFSKLRGVVKGTMIGFRYITSSSSSSSTSSSSPSAPGSSVSEAHKFQIKFKAMTDCVQCATLLSYWIECQSVAPAPQGSGSQGSSSTTTTRVVTPTATTTINASPNLGSQTLAQSSQDTVVTMAPPPPPSNHYNKNNSSSTRFEGAQSWSQNLGTGTTAGGAPFPTSAPPGAVSVDNEELAQILRFAATNNTFPPTTTTLATAASMSSQSLQEQQQRNCQDRLASFTPRFASQPVPIPVPAFSVLSPSIPTPVPMVSASISPSGQSGRFLQRDRGTYESSFNNNNNSSSNNSSDNSNNYGISAKNEDLASLLNASDAELQEDINSILNDPTFPDLLLKVDLLLRGRSRTC